MEYDYTAGKVSRSGNIGFSVLLSSHGCFACPCKMFDSVIIKSHLVSFLWERIREISDNPEFLEKNDCLFSELPVDQT